MLALLSHWGTNEPGAVDFINEECKGGENSYELI